MACNCSTTTQCNNCCTGVPCGCPPDYTVPAQPVDCKCCPGGYIYVPAYVGAIGKGSGRCVDATGNTVEPIPCVDCVDSTGTDCVTYNPPTGPNFTSGGCAGWVPGQSLTSILQTLCPDDEAFVLRILQTIGLSTTLKAALCSIVSICPTTGSTIPIPGPIVVTVP